MTTVVRITKEAEEIALRYGKNVSQGIVGMETSIKIGTVINPAPDIEKVLRKILGEGVNLSPKEKLAFQNLNNTLVNLLSAHNKI